MSTTIEPVKDYIARKLKEAGSQRFESIADEAGVKLSFIRKFVYGSRPDPRIDTLQPLLTFFDAIDRGERDLPAPKRKLEAA